MAETKDELVHDSLITFAEELADAARAVALQYFRTDLAIEDKADDSPVTLADKGAEKAMRTLIGEHYPEHGILGEEFGHEGAERDWTWVLDPIDGTGAFIIGMPLFGVLIALAYQGRPVLGVIDAPALNERWVGALGRPTLFNGKPCKTSDVKALANATLHSTSTEMFEGRQEERFKALGNQVKRRRYGGDCYQYGLMTLGGFEIVIEHTMKPHDYMALVPVVESAGGVVSDWSGEPLSLTSNGEVLACANAELHQAAIEALTIR